MQFPGEGPETSMVRERDLARVDAASDEQTAAKIAERLRNSLAYRQPGFRANSPSRRLADVVEAVVMPLLAERDDRIELLEGEVRLWKRKAQKLAGGASDE